ncbi:MAG: hypothetical protein GY946_19010 [bacterium]|nr:hypothetical protein [bacterium]
MNERDGAMTDHCFGPEDLDDLLSLAENDPRHQHLDGCSACRSLLAAYRTYLDPGTLPEAADPRKAHEALQRFVSERILDDNTAPDPEHSEASIWQGLIAALRGPVLGPALALVVLLVALTAIWNSRESLSPERRSGIVREIPNTEAGETALAPSATLQDGAVLLSWHPVKDADAYRVQVLSADLILLEEIEAADQLSVLREASGTGAIGFWRVIALKRGDEIARSGLNSLP